MKLTRQTIGEAWCPICALGGIESQLRMPPNSLEILCLYGHRFDTVWLSELAARVGKRDKV